MTAEENIANLFLCLDDIVNRMRNLGETITESTLVEKILRSLTAKFESKVSALEEKQDLRNITVVQLHGILTVFFSSHVLALHHFFVRRSRPEVHSDFSVKNIVCPSRHSFKSFIHSSPLCMYMFFIIALVDLIIIFTGAPSIQIYQGFIQISPKEIRFIINPFSHKTFLIE